MSFEPARLAVTRRRFRRIQRAELDRAYERPLTPSGRPQRIVLTGGPGSGKSTAASFLAREFVHDLWVLPEAATLLYRGGLPRGGRELGVQIAQRAIFGVQRSMEQAHGLQHPDRVQLCDRGTVDGAAYWPEGTGSFFRSMGTSQARELERYDVVIFLHTAALLPAGYERDLDVRTEDREQAIELDRRVLDLYRDHPHLIEIQSQGSFLAKLTSVRNAVSTLVGMPGGAAAPVPISALTALGSSPHMLP